MYFWYASHDEVRGFCFLPLWRLMVWQTISTNDACLCKRRKLYTCHSSFFFPQTNQLTENRILSFLQLLVNSSSGFKFHPHNGHFIHCLCRSNSQWCRQTWFPEKLWMSVRRMLNLQDWEPSSYCYPDHIIYSHCIPRWKKSTGNNYRPCGNEVCATISFPTVNTLLHILVLIVPKLSLHYQILILNSREVRLFESLTYP